MTSVGCCAPSSPFSPGRPTPSKIVEGPTLDRSDDDGGVEVGGAADGGKSFRGGLTGVGVTGHDAEPDIGGDAGIETAPWAVFVGSVCGGVAPGTTRLATDGEVPVVGGMLTDGGEPAAGMSVAGRGGASVGCPAREAVIDPGAGMARPSPPV